MIPQTHPLASYLAQREAIDGAIRRCLESGRYILGPEVEAFEREFAAAVGASWAVGVANGTDAIELALRALDIGPGDHVITPSHTASATGAAILRAGAIPLFADIEPGRYTLDPAALERVLTTGAGAKAKAIIVVHLYGLVADMVRIMELANHHGIPVIEDCAQAHGARGPDRPAGSCGRLACYSFYPTKNLGAIGDGGAVTGADRKLDERIRELREYGWRERYISDSAGCNSRLDELQAAILRAKLPALEAGNTRRREIAAIYDEQLAATGLTLPARYPGTLHVYHQYVVECVDRESLRSTLREAEIGTLVHYPRALHQQAAFQAAGHVTLPHTEAAIQRILSLPIYPELTDKEAHRVAGSIRDWCDTARPA